MSTSDTEERPRVDFTSFGSQRDLELFRHLQEEHQKAHAQDVASLPGTPVMLTPSATTPTPTERPSQINGKVDFIPPWEAARKAHEATGSKWKIDDTMISYALAAVGVGLFAFLAYKFASADRRPIATTDQAMRLSPQEWKEFMKMSAPSPGTLASPAAPIG